MTRTLTLLFGRLPIGWLQLTHNRARFAAALAGVAFANLLIFMQLGFLGALQDTTTYPYALLDADILISASDANTISDGSPLPRQRMLQALATPGVAEAAPLYLGKLDWDSPDGDRINFHVFGFDPRKALVQESAIGGNVERLSLLDRVLIDERTRNLPDIGFAAASLQNPVAMEANGRTVDAIGTFAVGAGFDADGYMVTSDETFLNLLPNRVPGAPSHVLVKVAEGIEPAVVVERLRDRLSASDSIVRSLDEAAKADRLYQTQERPMGLVFGFGVVIGLLVGVVIVYQVLSSDVADHLREYATFKAIGYRQRFFLGIVFEEALALALIGFVPGLLISLGLYQAIAAATGLPMEMNAERAIGVFLGTLAMCALSGAVATRRLAAADPADLF